MSDAGVGIRWSVGCIVLMLLFTACGNSSPGVPASSGGAGNSGASSGGGAGSGGFAGSTTTTAGSANGGMSGAGVGGGAGAGGSAPVTKYQACVAYMNAQCNRRYRECRGFDAEPDPCPEFISWCPDFLFSDGSQMDIAGALTCAETWRNYSCDLLNTGFEPHCGPVGKRALGEPCVYGRQCASMECGSVGSDNAHPDCGVCIPVGVTGDICNKAPIACPDGDECTGAGCQVSVQFDLPDGALCERYAQCDGMSLCFPAPDGMMRCQPQRKAGEDCSNGAYCEPDTTCGDDYRCAASVPVQLGELCLGRACASGGWCDGEVPDPAQAVCIAQANAGEPCHGTQQEPAGNCRSGLTCYCEGTGCAHTCLYQRREGEACGDTLSYCIPGTTCEAGKCVGVELQGLATAACGQ
ncbi:MAG: hypothetical protein WDO69_35380 [Pseudomonadota bacterium]